MLCTRFSKSDITIWSIFFFKDESCRLSKFYRILKDCHKVFAIILSILKSAGVWNLQSAFFWWLKWEYSGFCSPSLPENWGRKKFINVFMKLLSLCCKETPKLGQIQVFKFKKHGKSWLPAPPCSLTPQMPYFVENIAYFSS